MEMALFIAMGAGGVEPFSSMFGFNQPDNGSSSRKHQAHISNQNSDGSFSCELCGIIFRQNDGSRCNR